MNLNRFSAKLQLFTPKLYSYSANIQDIGVDVMTEIKATVAERLSDLLSSEKFCDAEFIFRNGDRVKGHKLIFAIASPVFEAMMYGDLAKNEDKIKVDDIDSNGFKTMTEFIYSDKLQLKSVDHAISVYKAADKYDLQHLQKKTSEYIRSNVQAEYAIEILEFSRLYSIMSTEEMCYKLLQEKTKAVVTSDYASKCCISSLETIVNENKLKVPEVELFKLVDNWAKFYAESNDVPIDIVRPLLKNIIAKIRFLAMTMTDFVSSPFKSPLLSVEEKHSLLLNLNEPNSVPLPENFCDSTKFRDSGNEISFECRYCFTRNYDDQYLIQWRLKEILKTKVEKIYSPTFYVGDYPFKILFETHILEGWKYIGLLLKYDWEGRPSSLRELPCTVKFTFRLYVNERKPIRRDTPLQTFDNIRYHNAQGSMSFCRWLDVSNQIISKDDYILIEVDLKKSPI